MRPRAIAGALAAALVTMSVVTAIGVRARAASAQGTGTDTGAGSADSSVAALERAARAAPDDAEAHYRLALAYARQGGAAGFLRRTQLARRMASELRRTIALAPGHVLAHEEFARYALAAPALLGGGMKRARAEAAILRTIAPERSLVLVGWIAHHENRARAAEQSFRAAIAQYPDSAAAYLALGHLLRDAERNDDAFAAFARASALKPDNRQALYQMGLIGALTGTHLEAAEAAMLKFIGQGLTTGEASAAAVHRRMGLIFEKRGKVAQARAEYTRTLELRSADSDAREGLRRLK